jgi:hypothetical protein
MSLTDNELTNILGAVLVLAVLVHTVAQIVIPIVRCRNLQHQREFKT